MARKGEAKATRNAGAPGKPRHLVNIRPLTDFQEIVCNLAADLILRGGAAVNVTNLLRATIGHSLHLRYPDFDALTEQHIAKSLPEWRQRISRHWPEQKDQQRTAPETITEMLRENLRGNLERLFGEFLARARMHELYLMRDVLGNFESDGGGVDITNGESVLARAFTDELSSDHSYVKVPIDHLEAVEDFLEKLTGELETTTPKAVVEPKLLVFPARQPSAEAPSAP